MHLCVNPQSVWEEGKYYNGMYNNQQGGVGLVWETEAEQTVQGILDDS